MEKVEYKQDIFVINNFLTKQECEDYILLGEQRGYEEATVTTPNGPRMLKGVRNNDRVLYKDELMAEKLWKRIEQFIPSIIKGKTAYGLNELFRFYRYQDQQRFNWHKDGTYYRDMGDQSYLTLLFYLNDDFEGGATSFENFDILPQQGSALIFEHSYRHKGCAVDNGVKYVFRTDVMYKR